MPSQRGGRRPGAGRRMGSKNRIPKPKAAVNRLNEIVSELETGEYLYSTADKKYMGTAMELLQSIYRAESLPVKIRLYAATKAVDYEPKPMPQQDVEAETDEAAEFIIAELKKLRKASIHEWDRWLQQLIDDREISDATALKIRARVLRPKSRAQQQADGVAVGDDDIPAWQPVKPPEIAWNEGQARDKNSSATAQNGGNGRI